MSLYRVDSIHYPSSSYSNSSSGSSSGNFSEDESPNNQKNKNIKYAIKNELGESLIYNTPYNTTWFETEFNLDLNQYIRKLFLITKNNLSCNVEPNTTKAILVPHAGISHSGLCSASAYYELTKRTRPIKNIILLCTSHYSKAESSIKLNIIAPAFANITTSINANKKSQTMSIDTELITKLKDLIHLDIEPFYNEHSFFNQIPFLELVAPNATLCPLLIGDIILDKKNMAMLAMLIKTIKERLMKSDSIIICTSDLSHVNGHFPTKINNNIFQNIRRQDNETLKFLYNIIDGNESRNKLIDTILFMQNTTTCGINAIYVFGKILHSLNNSYSSNGSSSSDSGSDRSNKSNNTGKYTDQKYLYSRISCYYSSVTRDYIKIDDFNPNQLISLYEISNNKMASVSYASIIFTKQPYIQSKSTRQIDSIITEYEKLALIGLARENLFYFLSSNKVSGNLIKPIYSPAFDLSLGIFVTIHKKINGSSSQLRGCIGTLETNNDESTIESNIKKYVIESAIHDKRFTPISIDEYNRLEFSITILDSIKSITLNQYMTDKFQLGHDGILMKIGNQQGYFLPSVATDLKLKKTDKTKLLDELCREKVAGCDTKMVFRKNANVQLYYNEGLEFNI
jgi:uncharacterized protein (TIGR00296 family)/AmmeMemoRadiSam system protein B